MRRNITWQGRAVTHRDGAGETGGVSPRDRSRDGGVRSRGRGRDGGVGIREVAA